jgi:hypothetical protein
MRNGQSCITLKDREKYPFDETLLLFTSNGNEENINDIEALSACFEELSVDTDKPLIQRIVPITSIEVLTNRQEIFLQSIEFCGYDMSVSEIGVEDNNEDEGEQDETGTDKSNANEQIINNMVSASWQPNFFKPSVRIGGVDVASNIANTAPNKSFHNLSIGLPLPYCLQINKVVKEPKDIEITASFVQAYRQGGEWRYRNYPILAIVNFWQQVE